MKTLSRARCLAKLGNALRALQGGWYSPPQKSAAGRVRKWLAVCSARGCFSSRLEEMRIRSTVGIWK